MTDTVPLPTPEQQQRAKWDLLLLDTEHRIEQIRQLRRWEAPRAIAMVVLVVAALFAALRLPDLLYLPKTQTIVVRLEPPIILAPH